MKIFISQGLHILEKSLYLGWDFNCRPPALHVHGGYLRHKIFHHLLTKDNIVVTYYILNVSAIFQKAESLYHLGDFEHSLMYYHRGLRIRPELEGFRLGIQKAQEAIENTIGSMYFYKNPFLLPSEGRYALELLFP